MLEWFQAPPQRRRDLCSSGIFHSVDWYFCTDVSGQCIGSILKESRRLIDCGRWDQQGVPKRRYEIATLRCRLSHKNADRSTRNFVTQWCVLRGEQFAGMLRRLIALMFICYTQNIPFTEHSSTAGATADSCKLGFWNRYEANFSSHLRLRFTQVYCWRFDSRFLYCIEWSTPIIAWRDTFGTMNTCLESNPDITPLFVHCSLGGHIEGDVQFKCDKTGSFFSHTFMCAKSVWRYFCVWLHVHDRLCAHTHKAIKIFSTHFMNFGLICCISVNGSKFYLFRKIPF